MLEYLNFLVHISEIIYKAEVKFKGKVNLMLQESQIARTDYMKVTIG